MYFHSNKWRTFNPFFRKCVVKNTTKNVEINLFICTDDSFRTRNEKVHTNATFHLIKMIERLSSFAYISTRESDSTLIFLSEDTASKALQKLYKQNPIVNKNLSNILIITFLFLCHFFRRTEGCIAYCTLYWRVFRMKQMYIDSTRSPLQEYIIKLN